MLAEYVGVAVAVAVGLADGLGAGNGLPFSGGLTIAGIGVGSLFSEGSTVSGGKRLPFGALNAEMVALTMSFPLTTRSRLPELAT